MPDMAVSLPVRVFGAISRRSPLVSIAMIAGRAALMSILKTGTSSTLDVINGIKQKLPQIQALLPPGLKIQALGDQSIFVRAALSGVVREGAMAAALTGLMVLLFLGSGRSTAIIFKPPRSS